MHKPSNTLQQVKEWLEKRSRFPFETMKKWDALYYIQQLESRLAQVERERDAAVNDIEPKCDYCAFMHNLYGEFPCPTEEELETDAYCFGFKWRGVCEENTKGE